MYAFSRKIEKENRNMKKIVLGLVAFFFVFMVVGCVEAVTTLPTTTQQTTTTASTQTTTQPGTTVSDQTTFPTTVATTVPTTETTVTTEEVDLDLFPDQEWVMLSNDHEDAVEITMWIPNSSTSSMGMTITELVNLFNMEQALTYPGKNISVIVEFQGFSSALNTKLQAAILSGNNPIISAIGVSSVPLYEEKAIDLRTVFTYDEIGQQNLGLMQYSLFNGKLMLNPYFPSASNILVANKTLIESKEFTLPTPESIVSDPDNSTWTWNEFKQIAVGVTTINAVDEESIYGFAANSVDPTGIMIEQGGRLYNDTITELLFDDNDMMETGLTFWRSLVNDDAMRNPNSRSNHGTLIVSEFYSGKVGMLFTTSSNLKNITDNAVLGGFEVEVLPFPKNTEFFVNQGGSGIMIFDNKPQAEIEAAVEFLRWLNEPTQNAYLSSQTGYLPINNAAAQSPALLAVYADYPMLRTVCDYMMFGVRSPQGIAKSAVDSKINAYSKQIWSESGKSISDIVDEMITEAQYEIDANN